jgi:hypothetical protein
MAGKDINKSLKSFSLFALKYINVPNFDMGGGI